MAIPGMTSNESRIQIKFEAVGMDRTMAVLEQGFGKIASRTSYYIGFLQTQMGRMMIAAGASIVAGMGVAVKEFASFDEAMKNTASVMSATAEEMDMLGKHAVEISTQLPHSAREVGDAMYFLASQGYRVEEVMKSLNPVMKLATATNTQAETTARYLMMTLNQFGASADEATRYAQVFASAISNTQLRMEWLGQAMVNVGPVAKQLGMSIEETTAYLAMLADAGVVSGKAGTHLRIIMANLTSATGSQEKALAKLGLTTDQVNPELRSMDEIFATLAESGAGVGDMFDLFNRRAGSSAMAVLGLSDSFKDYMDKVSDYSKLDSMVQTQMSALSKQFIILRDSIRAVAIQFGKELEEPIRRSIDWFRELAVNVGNLSPRTKQMMLGVASGIAALLFVAGPMILIMGTLTQSMLNMTMFGAALKITLIAMAKPFALLAIAIKDMIAILITNAAVGKFTIAGLVGQIGLLGTALAALAAGFVGWKIGKYVGDLVYEFNELTGANDTMVAHMTGWMVGWDKFTAKVKDFFDTMKEQKDFDKIIEGQDILKTPDSLMQGVRMMEKEIERLKHVYASQYHAMQRSAAEETRQRIEYLELQKGAFLKLRQHMIDTAVTLDKIVVKGPKINAFWTAFQESGTRAAAQIARDMDKFIDKLSSDWTNVIIDLAKGAKTFGDVWQMILDDALNNFINGFLNEMLRANGQAMGQMVAQFLKAQAFMGGGFGGGIFGAVSSLFDIVGGIQSGGGIAIGGGRTTYGPGNVPIGFPTKFAEGGIVTRPMLGMVGEAGPEAIVPLDQYDRGGEGSLTIINVVDPNFVNAQIAQDPYTVINVINADLIRGGSTRKTIRRGR
jgi:TP901 family phage tail tape measure protein